MTAFLADGNPIPAKHHTDGTLKCMGDNLAPFLSTLTSFLPPVPTLLDCGTGSTVTRSVEQTKTQLSSTARSHEPPPTIVPLVTHPAVPPTPCPQSLSPFPCLHRVDLDALEKKILRSLREDFLHLDSDDNRQPTTDLHPVSLTSTPTPLVIFPILSPCVHHVDLDALERKILHSLREDFSHPIPYDDPTPPTTALPTVPLTAHTLPPLITASERLMLLEAKIRHSLSEDFCHLDDTPDTSANPQPPTPGSTLLPAIYTTRFPFGMATRLLLEHKLRMDQSLFASPLSAPVSPMRLGAHRLTLHLPIGSTHFHDALLHHTMTHQSASLMRQYCPRPPAKPNPVTYPQLPACSSLAIPPAQFISHQPQSHAPPKDDHRPP